MSNQRGRCARQKRRTKQRKAKQAEAHAVMSLKKRAALNRMRYRSGITAGLLGLTAWDIMSPEFMAQTGKFR